MLKHFFILFLCTMIMSNFSSCQSYYMPGFDFRLFDGSPVEKLARAVENDDTVRINDLVKNKGFEVDYMEPKFGQTLVSLAMVNNKTEAFKKLLNLGANPNIMSKSKKTPLLMAAKYWNWGRFGRLESMKLLVAYGADVNYVQIDTSADETTGFRKDIRETALTYVCDYGTIAEFKFLVENGADIYAYPVDGSESLLARAENNDDLDILRYLLIEKKLPIPKYTYIRGKGEKNEEVLSLRYLVETHRVTKPEQIKIKQEILDYLASKGK